MCFEIEVTSLFKYIQECGKPSLIVFCFRYHDMPDVIDFLVLRQSYDEARNRVWRPSKSTAQLEIKCVFYLR